MSEKTIQDMNKRLRERLTEGREGLLNVLSAMMNTDEANAFIDAALDRLTAAPSEDVVERVARTIYEALEAQDCVGEYSEGDRSTWVDGFFSFRPIARAAIAAMPSAEAIRRDEREKCAEALRNLAELKGKQECCGVGAYSAGGGPPECCAEPLIMIDAEDAIAAIRARNEEK